MDNEIRPVKGFILALTTALLWGVLPVFLVLCLHVMDSKTITLYRFLFAAVAVGLILLRKNSLPKVFGFRQSVIWLTIGATVMLVINYVANVVGLKYLSPSSVQVLMQLAPFILMLGGIFLYKESFTTVQFAGSALLVAGLLLFFNERLPQILVSESENAIGIVIVVVAALTWAFYALCQKKLMRSMSAMQLTLLIYIVGTAILFPFSDPSLITHLNGLQAVALLFCCLNTVVAYGAFTEALRIWYASRVSAILALTPLFTYLSTLMAEKVAPDWFTQPELGWVAYSGGGMVIVGSILTAIGKKTPIMAEQIRGGAIK
ncbi:DMT family transporter [Alteromonas sp. ASW11-130]|uniref:DMT family transporter n=1 Tax=Alteromonas sp. ASW11-130 TaxID=3015775 RepID=UPI00224231C7|nr:DMT family transporter [Alteromonas sp. ASW11-130]MCW8092233.1 DMT family transporter [Alteromonas sp. ASW11-130]